MNNRNTFYICLLLLIFTLVTTAYLAINAFYFDKVSEQGSKEVPTDRANNLALLNWITTVFMGLLFFLTLVGLIMMGDADSTVNNIFKVNYRKSNVNVSTQT